MSSHTVPQSQATSAAAQHLSNFKVFKSLQSVHLPQPPQYQAAELQRSPHASNVLHTPSPSKTLTPPTDHSRLGHALQHTPQSAANRQFMFSSPLANTPADRPEYHYAMPHQHMPFMSPQDTHLMTPASTSPFYEHKHGIPMLLKPGVTFFPGMLPFPQPAHHHGAGMRSTSDEIPKPEDMPEITDDGTKPPYSYATLIGMAILRSSDRKMTLSQIYNWINSTFKWYQRKSGWQNSIRHNLSLNKAFRKVERPKGDPGKGHYWVVEKGCEFQFIRVRTTRKSSSSSLPSIVNAPSPNPLPSKPMPVGKENIDLRVLEVGHKSKLPDATLIQSSAVLSPLAPPRKRGLSEVSAPALNKRLCSNNNNVSDKPKLPSLNLMSNFMPPSSTVSSDQFIHATAPYLQSPIRQTSSSLLLTLTPGRKDHPPSMLLSPPTSFKLARTHIAGNAFGLSSPLGFEFEEFYAQYSPSPSRSRFPIFRDADSITETTAPVVKRESNLAVKQEKSN